MLKNIIILICVNTFLFSGSLSIAFAAINPPKKITSDEETMSDSKDLINAKYTNIEIKSFNFDRENKDEIEESLIELSESLYDSLLNAGPILAVKENQKVTFSSLKYKNEALVPENIKTLYVFHKDRSKYGIDFLTQLAEQSKADVIIYEKITNRRWKKFGIKIYKKDNAEKAGTGKLKPAIAVFNNFSKAQTYTYPTIEAKLIVEEEDTLIQSIISEKAIEAMKKAFKTGVSLSNNNEKEKQDKKSTNSFNSDATGGF